MDFPTRFDFAEAEPRIYKMWEPKFAADAGSARRPFSIVIPPPNVTGSLHMGHALNNTLQDTLTRFHRMLGDEVLYLPGTDHAGIATQYKVEQDLAKEKKTRFDLGREKFIERVWAWKEKYGNTILMQLRRLGCSCDWSRTGFTMDPSYSRAVRVAFVSLFKKGFIYRGERLVNWCPSCKTALSDLEVVQKKESGKLWHLRYPIKGQPGKFAVVATTRPETMLGDTAVACNPKDQRYASLIGKSVILPIVDREIPIIADEFVAMDFGTGLVKVTPAHDVNDFDVGERHKLPRIQVIDAAGKMTIGYPGLDRFECRKKLVADLEQQGLIEKIEDYEVALGRCYRSNTVLEPHLSLQWFLSMKPLIPPAVRAVEEGTIRFHPARFKQTYLDWMYNIKDWCISRQIWWGHRIPVWYCDECKAVTAGIETPSSCGACKSPSLRQDEDVLDTWFSSALWPFATLGWPEETNDLEKFYPTSVLVTAREIINLWVARMIVTGFEFCGDKPFTDVVINPIIQDMDKKRMSKSLGTGIDPLGLMDAYGTDALRWCLTSKTTGMQDVPMGVPQEVAQKLGYKGRPDESIVDARNFITKVWNACRYVVTSTTEAPDGLPDLKALTLDDRWILSRLASTIERYSQALERYEFGDATRLLFHFVWDEFCDYYIELSKHRMGESRTKQVLLTCVDTIVRLMHPIAPFVTEEIWQRLGRSELLMNSDWPELPESFIDTRLEAAMDDVIDAVRAVRLVRNKLKLGRSAPVHVLIDSTSDFLNQSKDMIGHLAPAASVHVEAGATKPPKSFAIANPNSRVYVAIEANVNVEQLVRHLEADLGDKARRKEGLEKKLGNPQYRGKAPAEVVEADEDLLDQLTLQIDQIRKEIESLRAL